MRSKFRLLFDVFEHRALRFAALFDRWTFWYCCNCSQPKQTRFIWIIHWRTIFGLSLDRNSKEGAKCEFETRVVLKFLIQQCGSVLPNKKALCLEKKWCKLQVKFSIGKVGYTGYLVQFNALFIDSSCAYLKSSLNSRATTTIAALNDYISYKGQGGGISIPKKSNHSWVFKHVNGFNSNLGFLIIETSVANFY